MPDENDVQITRHKRTLESIRGTKGEADNVNKQSGSGVSDRDVENRNRVNGAYASRDAGTPGSDTTGTAGSAKNSGPSKRTSQGTGPSNGPSVNTTKSDGANSRRFEELGGDRAGFSFRLKNPFNRGDKSKTSDRLFTQEEAEEAYDRLYAVYYQGSGIIDDILEIVVKDHEPVTIWQVSPEECDNLVSMHLSRATVDKEAARSARQLLAMYDRLYRYMIAGPRVKATYTHIKEHGGLSFR